MDTMLPAGLVLARASASAVGAALPPSPGLALGLVLEHPRAGLPVPR